MIFLHIKLFFPYYFENETKNVTLFTYLYYWGTGKKRKVSLWPSLRLTSVRREKTCACSYSNHGQRYEKAPDANFLDQGS